MFFVDMPEVHQSTQHLLFFHLLSIMLRYCLDGIYILCCWFFAFRIHSALKIEKKNRCKRGCAIILYQHFLKRACVTVWSEGFLYKVTPPELKISPIMYFVIHNSVVLSKILKILVPFWPCLSMSIIIKIINFIK